MTLAAQPTSTPTPIAALDWPVVMADSFVSNEYGWPVEETNNDSGRVIRKIADGIYRWETAAKQGLLVLAHPNVPLVSDFYATVEGKMLNGPNDAEYGLVFRELDRDNFYSFGVRGSQFAAFRRANGEWAPLIDWTQSDALQANQKNTLSVWGRGAKFSFFINGRLVGETEDSSFTYGATGLLAEVPAGSQATFEFDAFELRASGAIQALTPVSLATAETTTEAGKEETCVEKNSPIFPKGALLVCDSFNSSWNVKSSELKHLKESSTVENGKLLWNVEAEHGLFSQVSPTIGPVDDFYLSVEAQQTGGPSDVERGLLFRKTDEDNLYTFSVRDDGNFGVFALINGEWSALIGWRPSPSVEAGKVVRLTILAQGHHTVFYLNDQRVAESDAIPPARGEVGVAVSLGVKTAAAFEFDNFELRTPATEQPSSLPVLESSERACVHPSLLAPKNWPVAFCSSFGSDQVLNRQDWPLGDSSNEFARAQRHIGYGKYVWDIRALQGVFSPAVSNIADLTDFYVTVQGQLKYGPRDAAYGVLFRYLDAQNFYFFEISDNGYYQFAIKQDGKWEVLIPWTKNAAIQTDKRLNRLTVIASGDEFQFYVNDQPVDQRKDDRLKSGGLGLAIELFNKNDKGGFEWDSFGVWI